MQMIAEDRDRSGRPAPATWGPAKVWNPTVSMYTELLRAALDELPAGPAPGDEDLFFSEVLQRRRELVQDLPPEMGTSDAVPVVLARQVGYDVSLIRLAVHLGVETDPERFGPTGHERTRLEQAFRDLGLGVGPAAWPVPYGEV